MVKKLKEGYPPKITQDSVFIVDENAGKKLIFIIAQRHSRLPGSIRLAQLDSQ